MVSSVASIIMQFNMNNIEILLNLGYQVDIACNFEQGNTISSKSIVAFKDTLKSLHVNCHHIDFSRESYIIWKHCRAYKALLDLTRINTYDFIHCHAPISSAISRLVAFRTNTPVIYTAHGLHFYKGSSLLSWLLYYPMEWTFAKFTNTLITINQEDFEFAKKHLKADKVEYLPGVGVQTSHFRLANFNVEEHRKKYNVSKDEFVILSVGELSKNKNHQVIIKALYELKDVQFTYLIAGIGKERGHLQALIDKFGLHNKVRLLGYQKDIPSLCNIADVFAFPSIREGLPFALVEAMASGLPSIVSNARGIRDVAVHGETGMVYYHNNSIGFACGIETLMKNLILRKKMGMSAQRRAEEFDIAKVSINMSRIYREIDNISMIKLKKRDI